MSNVAIYYSNHPLTLFLTLSLTLTPTLAITCTQDQQICTSAKPTEHCYPSNNNH